MAPWQGMTVSPVRNLKKWMLSTGSILQLPSKVRPRFRDLEALTNERTWKCRMNGYSSLGSLRLVCSDSVCARGLRSDAMGEVPFSMARYLW